MTIQRSRIQPLDTLLALKAVNLAPDLKANDRRVAAALLEHFNRKTGRCDPGLERIAKLLGISTRTVIRSNHRLERAGLFKRVPHGGLSNRNSYEPNWPRFKEIEAAWRVRLHTAWQASQVSKASPVSCHPCHLTDDNTVTQTYKNNLIRKTYQQGLPKEEEVARDVKSEQRLGRSTVRVRASEAAETAAERRWCDALHAHFGSLPRTYAEVIEAITPVIQAAATAAEMHRRGAGVEHILDYLHLRESPSPQSRCPSDVAGRTDPPTRPDDGSDVKI
jgi:hypothetical protein